MYIIIIIIITIIVPTPTLVGREELYTQLGFFCSFNFGRSIYSSKRIVNCMIKNPVQRRIRN